MGKNIFRLFITYNLVNECYSYCYFYLNIDNDNKNCQGFCVSADPAIVLSTPSCCWVSNGKTKFYTAFTGINHRFRM